MPGSNPDSRSAARLPDDLTITWMRGSDAAVATAIEGASFDPPLDDEAFRRMLNGPRIVPSMAWVGAPSRRPHPFSDRPWAVRAAGFAVYRFEYLSIEVLRLAVAPEFRRMGIGGALLAAVVRKLEQTAQRRLATLRVPEELLDAQLWLKAMGWRCVDVDDGCYVFEVRSRNDGRMEGGRDVGAWQEDR